MQHLPLSNAPRLRQQLRVAEMYTKGLRPIIVKSNSGRLNSYVELPNRYKSSFEGALKMNEIIKETDVIMTDVYDVSSVYPECWIGVVGMTKGTDIIMDMHVFVEPQFCVLEQNDFYL